MAPEDPNNTMNSERDVNPNAHDFNWDNVPVDKSAEETASQAQKINTPDKPNPSPFTVNVTQLEEEYASDMKKKSRTEEDKKIREEQLRQQRVAEVLSRPFTPSIVFAKENELREAQTLHTQGDIDDETFAQLVLTQGAANEAHLQTQDLRENLIQSTNGKDTDLISRWNTLSLILQDKVDPEKKDSEKDEADILLERTSRRIDRFVRYSKGPKALWYKEAKEEHDQTYLQGEYYQLSEQDRRSIRQELEDRIDKLEGEVDTRGLDREFDMISRDIDRLSSGRPQGKETLTVRIEALRKAVDRANPSRIARYDRKTAKYEGVAEDLYAERKQQAEKSIDKLSLGTEFKLWTDAQYLNAFQENERFNRSTMPVINREGTDRRNWPTYYANMELSEQKEIDARRELVNAAHYKRFSVGNLEQLSKNEAVKGLATEETARLYKIPGVKDALKIYVDLMKTNEQLFIHTIKGADKRYSLREATTDEEVGKYREVVQQRIKDAIIQGYQNRGRLPDSDSEDYERAIEVFSRDAEQIAFNLHYVANTFESIDSVWVNGKRVLKPSAPVECVNAPIRSAMKPLDGLIYSTTAQYKGTESISKWANNCIIDETSRLGINKLGDYDEVVILGEDKSEVADRYWTIEQLPSGKTRLYAPEARPVKLVGSMWEETKVGDKTLMEYIESGDEIPWNSSDLTQKVWADYSDKLDKANKLLAFFKGDKKVNFSSTAGAEFQWAYEANSALTDMKMATNREYKRWMVYHSVGIVLNQELELGSKLRAMFMGKDRKPRLPSRYRGLTKTVMQSSSFGSNELFFTWDKQPLMERGL